MSCCPPAPVFDEHSSEGTGIRIIGLDIHRAFAEAVAWQEGKLKRIGCVDMRRDQLEAFAATLSTDDVVVVEATGNAAAVAAVINPHVKRVVIANPMQVRVIAHAKINDVGARSRGTTGSCVSAPGLRTSSNQSCMPI